MTIKAQWERIFNNFSEDDLKKWDAKIIFYTGAMAMYKELGAVDKKEGFEALVEKVKELREELIDFQEKGFL
jgi:hypothetical protein